MDPNWPGFVDANGDGVNDNFDKDKDGNPEFPWTKTVTMEFQT